MNYQDMINRIKEISDKNDHEMTVSEYKELQKLRELVENKKNKLNRVWIFIMGGVIIVGAVSICLLTGCLSSGHLNQMKPKEKVSQDENATTVRTLPKDATVIEVPDTSKFVGIWNKKVVTIKYDNIHLGLDFNKYTIQKSDANIIATRFLNFDKIKIEQVKVQMQQSKFNTKYIPIVKWIEERNKIHYTKDNKQRGTNMLMEYIANISNPGKPFSNNTIDIIIQLNEFCYYFERNKDNFYRDGYTRNIESCKELQIILDRDGIDHRLK